MPGSPNTTPRPERMTEVEASDLLRALVNAGRNKLPLAPIVMEAMRRAVPSGVAEKAEPTQEPISYVLRRSDGKMMWEHTFPEFQGLTPGEAKRRAERAAEGFNDLMLRMTAVVVPLYAAPVPAAEPRTTEVCDDAVVSVAKLLRERFHELDDAVVMLPWAELGDDQLGWLDLVREVRALLAAERVSEDTATQKPNRPEIICISGSTRFIAETAVLAWEFEKEGKIVVACHLLPDWYTVHADHQAEVEGIAGAMDELHLRKIDLCDRVFVFNKDGYIGDSTRREIAYAESVGKPVVYLEKLDAARSSLPDAPGEKP